MKKIIFTLAFILVGMISALAQEKDYCMICWQTADYKAKVLVSVDAKGKKQFLAGEDGKTIVFNSPMEAMKYMSNLGWALETPYSDGEFIAGNMRHYWVISKPANGETLKTTESGK